VTTAQPVPGPAAQRGLIDRVTADLSTLQVVRGLWLTGSFGAGTADEHSDVDMFVLVPDADRDGLVGGWPGFVSRYSPLLVKRLGAAPVYTHLLPGWLRWDVVIGTSTDLATVDRRRVEELFNKDGATPGSPGHRGADLDVVREMTEEFLRVLGLLVVVLARDEMVAGVSGSGLLRQLLVTLLRYRAEGDRLSGALHLSRVLPADELAALAALPVPRPERESVIEAHLACARLFLPVARQLLREAYPADLESACRDHLHTHLGITLDP
jgi:hypothetical protein